MSVIEYVRCRWANGSEQMVPVKHAELASKRGELTIIDAVLGPYRPVAPAPADVSQGVPADPTEEPRRGRGRPRVAPSEQNPAPEGAPSPEEGNE